MSDNKMTILGGVDSSLEIREGDLSFRDKKELRERVAARTGEAREEWDQRISKQQANLADQVDRIAHSEREVRRRPEHQRQMDAKAQVAANLTRQFGGDRQKAERFVIESMERGDQIKRR